MHRNRTWTLDPPEWRTQRNRLLPIEGGDGSTLNLDFTTGILDPRITFTRDTNATFVNAQGYVQYALANMQPNTNFDGIGGTTYQLPWGGFLGTGASFERLSSGVLKCKAATSGAVANSNRAFLTTTATIPIGLPITLKVTIQDKVVLSTLDLVNFLSFTNATTSYTQYYVNGVKKETTFTEVVIGDVITLTVLPTQANGAFRVGLGCNVNLSLNNYVTIANVMLQQGEDFNSTYTYLPNSSTTVGNYSTPRFDYSPTNIGEPRGLLIEGTSKSFITLSETFSSVIWGVGTGAGNDVVLTTVNTSETLSPNGFNNAAKLTKPVPAVPGQNGYGFIRQTSINVGPPSGPRTISIWVKQPTSNAARYFGLRATGDGFAPSIASRHATFDLQTGTVVANAGTALYTNVSIVPYRNGWYRISATTPSMAGETPAGLIVASYSIVRSDDGEENNAESGAVYIWGPQLEIGTGASSYIPTGASTVARTEDMAYISGTNFSSWFTGASTGTMLVEYYRSEKSSTAALARTILATREAANQHFHLKHDTSGTTVVLADSAADKATASYLYGGRNRTAFTYNGASNASVRLVTNGETITTAVTSNTTPANATHLTLGYPSITLPTTNNAAAHLNSTISKIKYYPTVLTDNVLKEITSPNYVAPTFDANFTTMSTGADLTAKGFIFNRLSPATVIGSQGHVQYADANMFRSSNDLSGTGWTRNNLVTPVAPSGIPAPNGSTTDITTCIPDTVNTQDHRIIQNTTLSLGVVYNISFYVKPNGYNYFYLFDNSANSYSMTFNLITNTVISTSGTSNVVIGTPDAAGWRKISFSFVQSTSTTGNTFIFKVHPDANFGSFAGNGTSGVLVWGFQLNPGTAASTYFPTTTAAYHAPRFDNTVLTSRTNFILQSNSFTVTPTWGQANGTHAATLQTGFEAAPFGLGGTATRITSSNENAGIKQVLSLPNIAGKIIVVSFYAKSNKVGNQNFAVTLSSSITLTTEATTVWQRFGFVSVNPLTEVTLFGGFFSTDTLDLSIFGFQVEYVPTATVATDYIPTTTLPVTVNTTAVNGLLMEGQTTNDIFFSENISTGNWTVQAFPDSYPTVNITGGVAPNNTNTANLLTEGTTGDFSRSIYQFKSAAAGTYTYSVWVKAVSGNTRFVRLVLSSGAGDFVYVTVNISTGAITESAAFRGTATAPSATVTPYPNSWYRIALTGTLASGKTFVFIIPSNTGTFAVSTTDYGRISYVGTGAQFAVWGVQVEAGSGTSSYIPTGASAVTRAADQCEMTSGVSNLYDAIASTGTMLIDVSHSTLQNTNGGIELGVGTGNQTNNNRVSFRRDGTIIGSTGLDFTATGGGQRFKTVAAFAPRDLASSRNNGTPILSAANPSLNGMNSIKFYIDAFNSGSLPVYGVVKQIQIWSTRLYNSTIQKLSAL
jgi:hypothetical protein